MSTTPTNQYRTQGTGIGDVLRAARTERGLSLAELQGRTKIRTKYLAALEEERFSDLPPYPFARGFLQTVALELGLSPEPLVQRLFAAMSGGEASSVEGWQRLEGVIVPAVPRSPARRVVMTAVIVLVVLGGAIAVHFARQFQQFGEPAPAGAPAVPSQAAPLAPQGAMTPPPAVPSVTATPTATPAPVLLSPGQGILVDLQASGLSWLLVVVDGTRVFEGFVTEGDERRWQGRGSIRIRVGNAAAVALTVNGRRLGTLGALGEVVDRTFSAGQPR